MEEHTSGATPDLVKPRLLALLRQARDELRAWGDGLTAEERAAIGTPDAWAPKDLLAHITSWRFATIALLQAMQSGEEPGDGEDVQRHNEETFERERLRPWAELQAESERSFEGVFAAVQALPDARFAPALDPGPDGPPFAGGFEHVIEHLTDLALKRGDWARAEQLLDRQTSGLLALSDSPRMHAYVHYSQAGFWAMARQPDRAIALLRETFALEPSFAEDARTRDSLDPLRDLPEFQSLLPTTDA